MIKIPKIFHYIWIGPYPIPTENYIHTWASTHPDYTTVAWTNSNPLIINYINEAINIFGGLELLNKFSMTYICDLVRLLILRDYGGIYLDHDINLIKNINPLLENKDVILTFQFDPQNYNSNIDLPNGFTLQDLIKMDFKSINYEKIGTINNCLIGTVKGHNIIKDTIDIIKHNHQLPKGEKIPMSDWTAGPYSLTLAAKKHGLEVDRSVTNEKNKIIVYHKDYLHPLRSSERMIYGEEWYKDKKTKIIKELSSYAIHDHRHFGADMYIQNKIITFKEWWLMFSNQFP